MIKSYSFTLLEKMLTPEFRKKVNEAESVGELTSIYSKTMVTLFQKTVPDSLTVLEGDIVFSPKDNPMFTIHPRLQGKAEIQNLMENSDLPKVLERFARSVNRRFKHLQKHVQKTQLKIRN